MPIPIRAADADGHASLVVVVIDRSTSSFPRGRAVTHHIDYDDDYDNDNESDDGAGNIV
jgi:hypothetical protein